MRTGTTFRFFAIYMASLLSLSAVGCDRPTGCGKDSDCKGDRTCVRGECVSPSTTNPVTPTTAQQLTGAIPSLPVPPGGQQGSPTKEPARSAAKPHGPRSLKYTCKASQPPMEVRGGCMCGSEIINLCFDPKAPSDMPQSPIFRIEGNTCIFEC
jgi:hypothetical protein